MIGRAVLGQSPFDLPHELFALLVVGLPNREFFGGLQGIKSGDQGKFCPDQGIPLSSAIWAFALPTIRTSRQISNLAEKANRDAARCSKSPKPISSSALSIPRRAAN